jgi:hypothetical protein
LSIDRYIVSISSTLKGIVFVAFFTIYSMCTHFIFPGAGVGLETPGGFSGVFFE